MRVRAPLVARHSWLGCAVWVCVLGLGFRLRPAPPGWGVGVCVHSCARFACTPAILAGVYGAGVCAWARVSSVPRHSWPGCFRVCVCLCARSSCTPPLLAGVCALGVCAWARVLVAPHLSWLGCWGGRVCVLALLVPRQSWLGCAASLCVLRLGFLLRPATPGWGVGVYVCSCARSAGALPLLAGVRGVGGCAWAPASAAPRNNWFGCWGLRVRALLVSRHSWLGCAVWVCLHGLGFRLCPATPGWDAGVWVRLRARSSCTPPLLADVFGVGVCAGARVSAAPCHSWLGCRGVCVLVCALCLYRATPACSLLCGRVCLGSWFGCTPPLLAGVCGVGVCAWARVSAASRHSWLGCWGVCLPVCALRLYPATPA